MLYLKPTKPTGVGPFSQEFFPTELEFGTLHSKCAYFGTSAQDPLVCGGGLVFLMTCPRTATHEETELLTVLKIPFRVRTPRGS
jgi:hypothetical protein